MRRARLWYDVIENEQNLVKVPFCYTVDIFDPEPAPNNDLIILVAMGNKS